MKLDNFSNPNASLPVCGVNIQHKECVTKSRQSFSRTVQSREIESGKEDTKLHTHTHTQAHYQFLVSKCWESEGLQQKASEGGRDRGRQRERARERAISPSELTCGLSHSLPHTHRFAVSIQFNSIQLIKVLLAWTLWQHYCLSHIHTHIKAWIKLNRTETTE